MPSFAASVMLGAGYGPIRNGTVRHATYIHTYVHIYIYLVEKQQPGSQEKALIVSSLLLRAALLAEQHELFYGNGKAKLFHHARYVCLYVQYLCK
jgi:hypothetical protein